MIKKKKAHGSLFSGVDGFGLAAEWMGWENKFHCEINPFGRQVSHYYWPKAKSYDDIKTTDFTVWRGLIDALTGGFPCQPYSTAGKRLGKEDERHLWPEMLRAIQEISPRWVVGENVRGLISWNGGMVFGEVQADLEAQGYEVLPFLLPAAGVNAPHRRDRIWFVAHRANTGIEGVRKSEIGIYESGTTANASSIGGRPNTEERLGTSRELLQNSRREEDTDKSFGYGQGGGIITDTTKSNEQWDRLSPICGQKEAGGCDSEINAADTINIGQQRPGQTRNGRDGLTDNNKADATHTDCRRSKGGQDIPAWEISAIRNDWSQFPTQSPVRSRNDGLPSRLVGITVSKHRNESLKAYGNAIVPQLAYQIFQAIEQYEKLNQ